VRAAILAGGKGTRLAPYTTVLPKPLVPVGERPVLELIIHQLAVAGFTRVDLCVAHLGELIRAYLSESSAVPDSIDIHYHWEDEPLGTAGAVRELERDNAPLLVMNGDILTTLDYGELMRFHERQGAGLTIATHERDVQLQLGVIEADARDVVAGYVEKPTLSYEVSMGIYVYGPEAIDRIPAGRFDFPDLVLALLADGAPVSKYVFDGTWYDIGTPGDLEEANRAIAEDPGRFDPALRG
jgi:NDP-sugar pyrophosphorylase family protein